MDNQQGSEVSEDFVAGLIVGEGSFCIVKANRRSSKAVQKQQEYRPVFTMAMCDTTTMNLVADAFRRWDLPLYLVDTKPVGPQRRPQLRIQISGVKRVKRIIEHLGPYLTGDKARSAELLLTFIESRLSNTARSKPFTAEEIAIAEKLSNHNRGVN